MTKIAVSFQCDTGNDFSTHSCKASTGINVKVVVNNIAKDAEQTLLVVLMNFKLIVEFYTAVKGKIYHQYHDTHDMEWPIMKSQLPSHGTFSDPVDLHNLPDIKLCLM